jgi:hypothetical protein
MSSGSTFLLSDLTGLLVSVTNASTASFSIIESIRLRRVGITLLPDSGSNAGFFSFHWGGEREPHTRKTTAYMPGVLTKENFYPPDGSLASFWNNQDTTETTTSVFEIETTDNTTLVIMDLQFEYVLVNGESEAITLSSASTFSGIAAPALPRAAELFYPVDLDWVLVV